MLKPIEFITALRNSDEYIEVIYTQGSCYQFSKLLKSLYTNAKAYKVKTNLYEVGFSHVITEIDGKYYDIRGELSIENFYGYEAIKDEDIPELEKWSFGKNNWLSRSCPYCGEDMIYERDTA